jgi:hypothetical protein
MYKCQWLHDNVTSSSVGWLLETGTENRHPTVIKALLRIYSHGSQKFKEPILIYNHVSPKLNLFKWPSIKLIVLYQFFHENHRFFKVFNIPCIGSSLILLKYLRNQNWWFFINSNNHTTLVMSRAFFWAHYCDNKNISENLKKVAKILENFTRLSKPQIWKTKT